MKLARARVEAVDDGLELCRHRPVIERRHQHEQISVEHFGHQRILDVIAVDARSIHMAGIAACARMGTGLCRIKDENLMSSTLRPFGEFL